MSIKIISLHKPAIDLFTSTRPIPELSFNQHGVSHAPQRRGNLERPLFDLAIINTDEN